MVEMKAKKVNIDELKFDEKGLIAAIAQDYESGEVLMQAFMNREAVEKTFETGYAHYYSRSRASLWKKGETSGNTQKVLTAYLDCDKDCILLKVRQKGVACHTGTYSCFSQQVKGDENEIGAEMFGKLQRIVEDRKKNPEEGSYTSFLFARGIDKIAKKAGEEAVDVTYTYDINSILEVEVTVLSTGVTEKQIIKGENNEMTDEEIEERMQELSYLKIHPREQEANKLLLLRCERIYEESVGDIRQAVEYEIRKFEEVLNTRVNAKIEKAREELKEALREIEDLNDET